MQQFTQHLIQDCRTNLPASPCDFAVTGLGSSASDERFAYSEIKEKKYRGDRYFRQFIELLRWRITLLGEISGIASGFELDDFTHFIGQGAEDPDLIDWLTEKIEVIEA